MPEYGDILAIRVWESFTDRFLGWHPVKYIVSKRTGIDTVSALGRILCNLTERDCFPSEEEALKGAGREVEKQ